MCEGNSIDLEFSGNTHKAGKKNVQGNLARRDENLNLN